MVENKEYTGGTPSVPSDDNGITTYPVVTPPFSAKYTDQSVSDSAQQTLCVADCIGVNPFEFTNIEVTGSTIYFYLYINGELHASKEVPAGKAGINFILNGDNGRNILTVLASKGGATFSGSITQTT